MRLDAALTVDASHLRDVARIAQAAEAVGFGALWTPETQHNGFFPLLVAAEHTQKIALGTAGSVAVPPSPMGMGPNAWGVQAPSGGRFILGLGPQGYGHIWGRSRRTW